MILIRLDFLLWHKKQREHFFFRDSSPGFRAKRSKMSAQNFLTYFIFNFSGNPQTVSQFFENRCFHQTILESIARFMASSLSTISSSSTPNQQLNTELQTFISKAISIKSPLQSDTNNNINMEEDNVMQQQQQQSQPDDLHMNMIKSHPLYPVLEMVFKKCELATKTNPNSEDSGEGSGEGRSSVVGDDNVTVEGLHQEINEFMAKLTDQESRYKLDLENREVDRLVSI